MASSIQYHGLCTHCTQAEHCTFPRDPGYHIRFCDEFCPPGSRCFEPIVKTPCLKPEKAIAVAQQHKGLCSNCDQQELCTFPKIEGVPIICCEEYY